MDVDLHNVLKRCLSAPVINNLPTINNSATRNVLQEEMSTSAATATIQSPNSSSREPSPAPILNIFAPRARRYSASFASLGANGGTGPRLTPRVSQLRQEECIDINSREVNHEREVHSAMQMSQSWEDLTLVTENWSCKSDDLTNPLQVTLPSGTTSCSSPSPTSRTGVRLPYGLSPSPTRRTFATRRSMSPIAMRPSQLIPVKRKFELDDNAWNTYSPPPLKKIFTESRGTSPVCQSPSSVCPSPDSGTYEGRTTPKLFVSKLYTNSTNSSSSLCSSPMANSPMMDLPIDLQTTNSSSPANTGSSSSNEPMSINSCDGETDSENGATNLTIGKLATNSKIINQLILDSNKTHCQRNSICDANRVLDDPIVKFSKERPNSFKSNLFQDSKFNLSSSDTSLRKHIEDEGVEYDPIEEDIDSNNLTVNSET